VRATTTVMSLRSHDLQRLVILGLGEWSSNPRFDPPVPAGFARLHGRVNRKVRAHYGNATAAHALR
jgi:hypothetical protein